MMNAAAQKSCPLCDSIDLVPLPDETRRWLVLEPGVIHRCGQCHLMLVLPQPTLGEYAQNFEEETYYTEVVGTKEKFFRQRVQLIKTLKHPQGSRLLDIGCATGEMLVIARENGFEVQGIELSRYASNYARQRFGLDVQSIPLEELPSNSFDIVHANHVLEHVVDPVIFAHQIYRILRPGGVSIVEVPNEFMNLMARFNSLLGKPRSRISPSIHLFFFGPETLNMLFQKASFRKVRVFSRTPRLSLQGVHGFVTIVNYGMKNSLRAFSDLTDTGQNIVCIARKEQASTP